MAEIESLDETCNKIFLFLGLREEKIGFNDLYRSLEKAGCRVSKPTLSEHLKHLTKKKVLIRKKVGKQRVSYEINWESFKHLLDAREHGKRMGNRIENQKLYETFSIEEILLLTKFNLEYVVLQQLRLSILATLNPEKAFEYNLELLFISKYFTIFKGIIIDECRKNKEFGKQILQKIESKIKDCENIIPDPQQTNK